MTNLTRAAIDPSKITTPIGLLTVFLIVVEGVALAWMLRAADSLERSVAGIVMVVILLIFLAAFYLMLREARLPALVPPAAPPGIDIGSGLAGPKDLQNPHPGELTGPDYVIDKPPVGWTARKMSLLDAMASLLGISDEAAKRAILPKLADIEVLSMSSPRTTTIRPTPGHSQINGLTLPSALETLVPITLLVIPMDRARPPLYIERTLDYSFVEQLAGFIANPLQTLRELPREDKAKSGRRRITAVLQESVTHVQVNGASDQTVDIYLVLVGVEGDVRDHLLMLYYPVIGPNGDKQVIEDRDTLFRVSDSFKSVSAIDPEAERRTLRDEANKSLEKLKQEHGERGFHTELNILGGRLAGKDMTDPGERLAAIQQLQPFELLAKELRLEDENLTKFWGSMHQAERGDPTAFIEEISELVESALKVGDHAASEREHAKLGDDAAPEAERPKPDGSSLN